MGKGKKKKAQKPTGKPRAFVYMNPLRDRTKPSEKTCLIPEEVLQTISDIILESLPLCRNVFMTVGEYYIKDINPAYEETSESPTHMIVFCLRTIIPDKFHPIGVILIDKRLDQTDVLVAAWRAYLRDLSLIRLFVIGTISPATSTFHKILEELTKPKITSLEKHTDYITYDCGVYKEIVHLYDYFSLLHETQEVFLECKELFFITSVSTDIIETDSKEGTKRLLELFRPFGTLITSHSSQMCPEHLRAFYEKMEDLRWLLASAKFKKNHTDNENSSLVSSSIKGPDDSKTKKHDIDNISATSENPSPTFSDSIEISSEQMEHIFKVIDNTMNNPECPVRCEPDPYFKFLRKICKDSYEFVVRVIPNVTIQQVEAISRLRIMNHEIVLDENGFIINEPTIVQNISFGMRGIVDKGDDTSLQNYTFSSVIANGLNVSELAQGSYDHDIMESIEESLKIYEEVKEILTRVISSTSPEVDSSSSESGQEMNLVKIIADNKNDTFLDKMPKISWICGVPVDNIKGCDNSTNNVGIKSANRAKKLKAKRIKKQQEHNGLSKFPNTIYEFMPEKHDDGCPKYTGGTQIQTFDYFNPPTASKPQNDFSSMDIFPPDTYTTNLNISGNAPKSKNTFTSLIEKIESLKIPDEEFVEPLAETNLKNADTSFADDNTRSDEKNDRLNTPRLQTVSNTSNNTSTGVSLKEKLHQTSEDQNETQGSDRHSPTEFVDTKTNTMNILDKFKIPEIPRPKLKRKLDQSTPRSFTDGESKITTADVKSFFDMWNKDGFANNGHSNIQAEPKISTENSDNVETVPQGSNSFNEFESLSNFASCALNASSSVNEPVNNIDIESSVRHTSKDCIDEISDISSFGRMMVNQLFETSEHDNNPLLEAQNVLYEELTLGSTHSKLSQRNLNLIEDSESTSSNISVEKQSSENSSALSKLEEVVETHSSSTEGLTHYMTDTTLPLDISKMFAKQDESLVLDDESIDGKSSLPDLEDGFITENDPPNVENMLELLQENGSVQDCEPGQPIEGERNTDTVASYLQREIEQIFNKYKTLTTGEQLKSDVSENSTDVPRSSSLMPCCIGPSCSKMTHSPNYELFEEILQEGTSLDTICNKESNNEDLQIDQNDLNKFRNSSISVKDLNNENTRLDSISIKNFNNEDTQDPANSKLLDSFINIPVSVEELNNQNTDDKISVTDENNEKQNDDSQEGYIDYENYRKTLEYALQKASKFDDVYRERSNFKRLYKQIPKDFEEIRLTNDWLCTFNGYLKLRDVLTSRRIHSFQACLLSLEHLDSFMHLIKMRKLEESSIYERQSYRILNFSCAINLFRRYLFMIEKDYDGSNT